MCGLSDPSERNSVFESLKGAGAPLDICFKASTGGVRRLRIEDGEVTCQ